MHLDSHQHFWQYDPCEHLWMSESMDALKRDFLPGNLKPLLDAAGFDGSIAVQARQSLAETRWLLELAGHHDFIKGVVGWVDLRSPAVHEQLAAFHQHPKLVGVRHVVQDEPDDEFLLGTDFQRGIAHLAEFGLTYDLLLLPRHLRVAATLAAGFPDQPFVLDHLGKPEIARRSVSPWGRDLRELARFPTVYCKLSGLVTEAVWQSWQREDFQRYLDLALEAFGPDRVMIGSDWPVCTLAGSYEQTTGIVREYIQQFSVSERAAIFGGNCAKFYGLHADRGLVGAADVDRGFGIYPVERSS